jgi:DNA-directed RNA polymerase subunit RPC12/RpoP
MKLVSLSCDHCGAPLEVPEKTKFVTCTYCSSRLVVRQTGGAAYTEVLEALDERTEKIADDVEILKLQSQLDRLDHQWMLERERYMVHDKHGHRRFPSKVGSVLIGVLVIGFAVFWMAIAARHGGLPVLFGFLFIAVAIFALVTNMRKADQYERRRRQYERRRDQLLRDIDGRRS